MKLGWVLALALALTGCFSTGGGNPNLLAPKVVVQPRTDGNVTLYVHGAFRDIVYDWISLSIENETVANRTAAFSLEHVLDRDAFFVDVTALTEDQLYQGRARIDVDWENERVLAATVDDSDEWDDPRAYSFPYELVLDRPRVSP